MNQDVLFAWGGEGDHWWQRNKAALLDPDRIATDLPLRMLERHGIRPTDVLEVGAANGYRLEAIRQRYGAECSGVDCSAEAIADGCRRYTELHLYVGRASCLPWWSPSFDCCLLPFVLHWVSRDTLAQVVAEVDRVLVDGGHLLIADFLPTVPTKVRYHHRQDVELWTYKQDYAQSWLSLATYREVDRWVFNHDTGVVGGEIPEYQRAAVTLLRKEEQYHAD